MAFAAILPMIMSAISSQGGGDKKGGGGSGGMLSSLPGTLEGVTSSLSNIGQARAGNAVVPAATAQKTESVGNFTPLQNDSVQSGHNPDSIKSEPSKGLGNNVFKLSDERQKTDIAPSGENRYSEMRGRTQKIRSYRG